VTCKCLGPKTAYVWKKGHLLYGLTDHSSGIVEPCPLNKRRMLVSPAIQPKPKRIYKTEIRKPSEAWK